MVWLFAAAASASPTTLGPAQIVTTLFEVAESGDVARLTGLCDPKGENDGDTKQICRLAADPNGLEEFQAAFKGGKLTDGATVEGDRAAVPFTFGPGYGGRGETLNLIRRDGSWYLFSF